MTFIRTLSRINKLVFFFGIAPYLLNRKSKKFESSIHTLIYSVSYFLSLLIVITYLACTQKVDANMFRSTFSIVIFLQQTTVMVIFCSIMIDFLLKRRKHAEFLNNLVQLDLNLAKFDQNSDHKNGVSSMYIGIVVCYFATVSIFTSMITGNQKQPVDYLWDVLQFFQSISVILVALYIRSFAVVLNHMCIPIFRKISSIGDDLKSTDDGSTTHIICQLMSCLRKFDEIMILKTQLSNIFGFQLLLNSAFEFTILTISAYGLMYFQLRLNSALFLYYFIAYNFPLIIKSVLLVEALETLANQVKCLKYVYQHAYEKLISMFVDWYAEVCCGNIFSLLRPKNNGNGTHKRFLHFYVTII